MRPLFIACGIALATQANAAVHIKKIDLQPADSGWTVSIQASAPTKFKTGTLGNPDRLTVDIPDAVLDIDASARRAASPKVPGVRYSQFTRNPNVVRVVVDLPSTGASWSICETQPTSKIAVALRPKLKAAPVSVAAKKTSPKPLAKAKPMARTKVASRSTTARSQGTEIESPPWNPAEAVAIIAGQDCPNALKARLIAVISDPAIQSSKYVWAGSKPGAFDCSGLSSWIYGGLDVPLPHSSVLQSQTGVKVDKDNLRAGDLVFFACRGESVSHVGVYLGENQFLHAANERRHLCITSLDDRYYSQRYAGARRVFGIDANSKR